MTRIEHVPMVGDVTHADLGWQRLPIRVGSVCRYEPWPPNAGQLASRA